MALFDPLDADSLASNVKLVPSEYGITRAYFNNEDVLPVIVNGNTLVPVRFITEATGLRVKWNQYTRAVSIDELVKAEVYIENDNEFITGYNENSFLEITIDKNKLNIQGKVEGYWGLLKLYNSKGKEELSNKFNIPANGIIDESINLSKLE